MEEEAAVVTRVADYGAVDLDDGAVRQNLDKKEGKNMSLQFFIH